MGAKGKTKYEGLFKIGQKVGKWRVINNKVVIDRYAKIECECECGKQSLVDAYTLSTGRSLSCISCFNAERGGSNNNSWRGYEEIPASWFTRFRNYAKKKGNDFEIILEDVWDLYLKQNKKCILSGVQISFTREGASKNASYTASIDRRDSSKGYTKENIQLVHKDINIMKNAFNQDYFIELCKAIVNNYESR